MTSAWSAADHERERSVPDLHAIGEGLKDKETPVGFF